MKILLTLLLILIALSAIYALVLVRPRGKAPKNPALLTEYAHRGLHGGGVPENSLAAFQQAVDAGFGIELDVQLSRDGVVMVFHDYSLSRMTGCDRKLCELDAAELQRLSLAGTDQTIPTFAQVLELVGGKVPLLVELKGETLNTALCGRTAELLKAYSGAYCIESFNPLLIRNMKTHLPEVFYGQLYTNVCRDKEKASALNLLLTAMAFNFLARPDFIAYNKQDRRALPAKLATGLHRAPAFVWTIKTEEELALARRLGEYPIFERESPPANKKTD